MVFGMMPTWNPDPFPAKLDDRERDTYYGVGLVMSHWASVEFELARLYSFFAGDEDADTVQLYGRGQIFRERLAILCKAAGVFFVRWPDQNIEGAFDRLTDVAEALSTHRNDVAHGIVFDVSGMTVFKMRFPKVYGRKSQYALVPPFYTVRRHDGGLPTYAYALPEMKLLAGDLLRLVVDVREFREVLSAHHTERLQARP